MDGGQTALTPKTRTKGMCTYTHVYITIVMHLVKKRCGTELRTCGVSWSDSRYILV